MAAVTNLDVLSPLQAHMMSSLTPTAPAGERANATRALFLTDLWGYTPRQLAVALGHLDAAAALLEVERIVMDATLARYRAADDSESKSGRGGGEGCNQSSITNALLPPHPLPQARRA
jgi:hypothetical protein